MDISKGTESRCDEYEQHAYDEICKKFLVWDLNSCIELSR